MRLLFVKEGVAIWSSHLDLMRALMRSFRRAGIELKHSQGFTPHPELSILMPLSVGVESQCEIAEFTLAEGCAIPAAEIAERMNPVLPAGIRALESWEGGQKAGKLAWLRARLTLTYEATGNRQQATGDGGCAQACRDGSQPSASLRTDEATGNRQQATGDGGCGLPRAVPALAMTDAALRCEALRALFARPSLVVEKHGKKGPTELDIAPMIRKLTVCSAGSDPLIAPVLAAGKGAAVPAAEASGDASLRHESAGQNAVVIEAVVAAQNPTLNPLLLVTAIETWLPQHRPDQVQCRRIEIYDADGKPFR